MELTQNEFDCLGQVAKHCNWSQLCIAINRAKDFDLIPLLCYDDWKKVSDSFKNFYALKSEEDRLSGTFDDSFDYTFQSSWEYSGLWNGSEFQSCGKYRRHLGLKRIWVYFSYAQYVVESAEKDTPTGRKILDESFSIPVQMKDLITIEKKYRSMAFEAWEDVKSYMCSIGMRNDCEECGCEECKGDVKKISGIKAKAVYK